MKNCNFNFALTLLVLTVISIQGCASDKVFIKKDLSTLAPLTVVRQPTPEFKVMKLGGEMLAGQIIGGLLLGGLGVGIAGETMAEIKGKELKEKASLPDYGELVMKEFVEKIGTELPNWPAMKIENQPVSKDYAHPLKTLLDFEVSMLKLMSIHGLISTTSVTLKDSNDNILWQKNFTYISRDFGRDKSIDEFEADNGILLKEEMMFAANKTVSDFIRHFKEGTQ